MPQVQAQDDQPAGWGFRTYFLILIGLAITSLPFVVAGALLGSPLLGVVPLAMAVLILSAAKPEAGLLMMLLLSPMEDALSISARTVTVIRLLGIYVLGAFMIHALLGKRVTFRNGLLIRQALLVLVMFISILLSAYPMEAMVGLQTQLAYLAFTVLAISLIKDWRMLDNAIVFMFLGCATGAALGLSMELLAGHSLSAERLSTARGRLGLGELSNPNAFARAVGMGLLMLPYMFWRFRSLGIRVLIVVGSLAISTAVVKAQTRAVWVSLAATVPAAFWFGDPNLSTRSAKTLGIVIVGLLALVIALQLGLIGEDIIERYRTLGEGVQAGGRTMIWRVCIAAFMDNPVFGTGYSIFGHTSLTVATKNQLSLPGNYSRDPHSSYMAVVADLGLAGIITFGSVLIHLARQLARLPKGPMRGSLIGMFLFMLVASITGTMISTKPFWMPIAVMAASFAAAGSRADQYELLDEVGEPYAWDPGHGAG